MAKFKNVSVNAVSKTYKSSIDEGDALADMKASNGWGFLSKWLIDRRKEGADISAIDSALDSDEVKMQVVLQRFKVELIDAIFAYVEDAINSAQQLRVDLKLDDGQPLTEYEDNQKL